MKNSTPTPAAIPPEPTKRLAEDPQYSARRRRWPLARAIPALLLSGVIATTAQAGADGFDLANLNGTSEVDPEEQFLRAIHASFDGEQWLDQTGWLNPGLHWCEWYGVKCSGGFNPPRLESVRLSGNGLIGEFSNELVAFFEADHKLPVFELDLSMNEISGSIPLLPSMINFINLSGNQLAGTLPVILPPDDPDASFYASLYRLDLSDNVFSGTIPSAWPESVSLLFLDLSMNLLEGSLEFAVQSMADFTSFGSDYSGLWVSDNNFGGTLDPEWFVGVELDTLDLCRTNITIDDPTLDQWIAERHWGGNQHLCLDREQFSLDPTISGSWFDPNRPGEGFSLLLLENGAPLVYWFSHVSFNRQFWMFNTGSPFESHVLLERALRTRGRFGSGFGNAAGPLYRGGNIRIDRVESNLLHVELGINYLFHDVLIPPNTVIPTPYPIPDVGVRADHVQLSRLAGTTCENQRQTQWISGVWFDPERSGEGFVVEVIEDGRGVVYWFTYTHTDEHPGPHHASGTNADWQAWMTGDGQIVGNTLTIDPLLRPVDTESTMPFEIEGVINQPIGQLQLHFDDDLNGRVDFISSTNDFPSLSYPIERLARPMLAECL